MLVKHLPETACQAERGNKGSSLAKRGSRDESFRSGREPLSSGDNRVDLRRHAELSRATPAPAADSASIDTIGMIGRPVRCVPKFFKLAKLERNYAHGSRPESSVPLAHLHAQALALNLIDSQLAKHFRDCKLVGKASHDFQARRSETLSALLSEALWEHSHIVSKCR